MSIHLSATYSPSVPLPDGPPSRKAFLWIGRAPGFSGLRAALARRARRRELEEAFARLAETAPHLLDDIGEAMPPVPEAFPFPASARGVASPFHVLPDAPARSRPPRQVRPRESWARPQWNAPMAWLR